MKVGEYEEAKNKIPNFKDLWQQYRNYHFFKINHIRGVMNFVIGWNDEVQTRV